MRNSRLDAGTIKNCAAHHGLSDRTVRGWRLRDDPRWRAWQARQCRSAEQLQVFLGRESTESDPESECEAARIRFLALQKICDDSVSRGDVAGLPVSLKAAESAQKLLASCRVSRDEWLCRRKQFVHIDEFNQIFTRYVLPVSAMLKHMPDEVAPLICPHAPHTVIAVLEEWTRERMDVLIKDAQAAFASARGTPNSPSESTMGDSTNLGTNES